MAMLSTVRRSIVFSIPLAKHSLSSSSSFPLSSSPPPQSSDENLVSATVTILKHHRSKSRWSEILSLAPPNSSGFTPSHVSQIILQLRNTPHLALRFFNFTIHHSICSHSLSSYATIIHILSRSRLKSQSLQLIKSAIRKFPDSANPSPNPPRIFEILVKTYRTCDSAPFVFDLLIKAYLDSKKIDLSVQIVRILAFKNIFPHVVVCNSLIELIAKSRGPFAAYDMYKEIFNDKEVKGVMENAYTFDILMLAFHREGVVEKVEDVWKEMMAKNCSPNVYSYSVLMAAYCEDERMENAMKVWEDMGDKGLKHDIVAYNTIIGGFCKVGEVDRAEEFYRDMVFNGVECTCVTLEHLINGHCMSGKVDAALVLYKDMCRKGFNPESSTIDVLAEVICDKSGVFEALEFVRAVIKKHDVAPRKTTYELLIRRLCMEGWMEEALKLQVEMVGKGYAPNFEIYSSFIDGYVKQRDDIKAEALRNEMLSKIPCKDS
ncbi:hypothetical protein BC332_00483 [Capsicum chinense]|nr:hypothetical protein BC332_00483 [Capsicum chinense]